MPGSAALCTMCPDTPFSCLGISVSMLCGRKEGLSFRMPKHKLHYLLKMQIPRTTKIQVWWDWVAKARNLSLIQVFPEWEKSLEWLRRLLYSLAVTFCSSHTVSLEVNKHARLALLVELYLHCSFYLKSSLLQIQLRQNRSFYLLAEMSLLRSDLSNSDLPI